MAVFFDGRCACGREVCDFTCMTYAAYMYMQNNIGACQERMKKEPITNADRIRAMSDEELADFMAEFMYCVKCWKFDKEQGICTRTSGCNSAMLDWLKQDVE